MAWGLWERSRATLDRGDLGEADAGADAPAPGIAPISDEQGLELFDARPARGAAAVPGAAASTAPPARAGAAGDAAADPARPRPRPARRAAAPRSARWRARLAALPEAERESDVLELVRSEVAAVLGHASAGGSTPTGPSRTWASTRSPRSSCATGSAPPPACACRRRWSSTTRTGDALAELPARRGDGERRRKRRSRVAARPARRSRSRSSAWPAATPAGSSSPEELWQLVADGPRRDRRLPRRPRLGPRAPL